MASGSSKMETMVGDNSFRFYKGKRVFVTGHTGFKGAWLLSLLHEAGAIVKGYALAPENENDFFQIVEKAYPVDSIIKDIRDKVSIEKELLSFQPDLVFHLAAQPLVRRSYKIPAETFEVNVVGTANLLEALTHLNKPCAIVVITTDKVYENKENGTFFSENDRLGGYDPYSASKACTEIVISSFRDSFFNFSNFQKHKIALASARAGNVIGGGDWNQDRIIPDIIKSLKNGKPIEVRNPSAVRPWQHVLEPLAGYLKLGYCLYETPGVYATAYNFGPERHDHLTVKQLVEQAITVWGGGSWLDKSDPVSLHEAGLLQLDIERAKSDLRWKPKLTAEQAIEWTIDWYKQPVDKQMSFSLDQIWRYLSI